MVIATDYVSNSHIPIVDGHTKIVSWIAVRPQDNKVVQLGVREHDIAVNEVAYYDLACIRILESNDRLDSGNGDRSQSATTIITRLLFPRCLHCAHLIEFLLRAVALIRITLTDQYLDDFPVSVISLCLVERPLIRRQPEPRHSIKNRRDGLGRRPFAVGVFNAQNERSSAVSCI